MNLISNCCIGGDYYNSLSKEYNNPFIWVIIKPKDMITLISHFNTINFENIELLESEFSAVNRKCFKIKVDNLFEIHYPHYLKNNDYKTIKYGSTETSVDVLYADIEKYIISTYIRRLQRMKNNSESPKFLILGDRAGYEWDFNSIRELDKINNGFKICLITDKVEQKDFKNLHIIHFHSDNHYNSRIYNDKEIRRYLGL